MAAKGASERGIKGPRSAARTDKKHSAAVNIIQTAKIILNYLPNYHHQKIISVIIIPHHGNMTLSTTDKLSNNKRYKS